MIFSFSVELPCVSLVAQMVKNLPAMQKSRVQSLGQGDTLEKEMAIHSSILAWRIPWVEEPGGRQYMGLQSRTQRSDQARPRGRCTSVQSAGCPFLLHHMVQGDWEGDGPPRFSISHPCPGACPPQKGQQMQAGPDVPWGPGRDPEWGQRDAG